MDTDLEGVSSVPVVPVVDDDSAQVAPRLVRKVTFGPTEIITFHRRDTAAPTLLLKVGARSAPKKLTFVGPVAREIDALQEAAAATAKNKRLLKIKRGATLQFFLQDGSELCDAVDELPDELVILVALGASVVGKRPAAACVEGACGEV